MFRVKFFVHGSDAPSGDWFVASSTEGATLGMVVGLAVRVALVIKETCRTK